MDYDVVVVGAGPAGSAVARKTAGAGLRTLVVEEDGEVGLPQRCSGLVTPRTVFEVGIDGKGLVLNEIKGAWVYGPGKAKLLLGGDRVRALALNRMKLDKGIAEQAVRAGAELSLSTRLTGIERTDGQLRLRLVDRTKGKTFWLSSRVVVGADGWPSRVARWMGVDGGRPIRAVSLEAHLPDHPEGLAQVFVGREIAPGWFAWTIPLGGGMVRLGIGGDPELTSARPRELLDRLVKAYPEQFRGVEPVPDSGGFIPLYEGRVPSPRLVADNALLVGDAARQVKPTSGGGIYTGLVAGRYAAEAIIQAFEKGDFLARSLAAYEASWLREFGEEFERALDIRGLFRSLGDEHIARLLKLLNLPGLRQVIRRYGDIDFQTPLYGQLLKALPVLRIALSLPSILPARWLKLLSPGRETSDKGR